MLSDKSPDEIREHDLEGQATTVLMGISPRERMCIKMSEACASQSLYRREEPKHRKCPDMSMNSELNSNSGGSK